MLLVPNFGWFDIHSIGDSFSTLWPLFLILWGLDGVISGFRRRRKGLRVFPLMLILLGGVLLLDFLGIASFSSWIIPGVLVLLGVSLLFGRRPSGRISIIRDGDWGEEMWGSTHEGGRHRTSTIKSKIGDLFVGGPNWPLRDSFIEQKIGSIRMDLSETPIPEGETVLEVECKMGDVDVRLPEGLAVSIEAHCKIGSVTLFDRSSNGSGALFYQSEGYQDAERKVRLLIEVKIGDLNVQRV